MMIRNWKKHSPCGGLATALTRQAVCLLALLLAGAAGANQPAYQLTVELEPETAQLAVDAVVDLPAEKAGSEIEFLLTSRLEILSSSPPVRALPDPGPDSFQGINGSSTALARRAGIRRYAVQLPPESARLELRYAGQIDFPLATQGEEYTRGFRETPGILGTDGVYLGGSTLWYPWFDAGLVSFRLNAGVPSGWHLISQGDGRSAGEDNMAVWDSAGLVDEIYLVGGPLTVYRETAGSAMAEVYLREADPALANRYLEATAQYIEMYRQLIGPYPYGKFALVENFWETGYGMPSFTLLGPQIIRFPFILTSSYPHEILHNWWGNSVFVDYSSGNWCEGLTAYMADHLIKEQQGLGAQYRRDTLKKYRDFVKTDRDFPLTEFRSRHSAATEAVGYGKTLMGFHMLRQRVGDDNFRRALQSFYRKQRGQQASFADIRTELEAVADLDLGRFFREWTEQSGAADLQLDEVAVTAHDGGYRVRGKLLQQQAAGPWELAVPLVLITSAGSSRHVIQSSTAATDFEIRVDAEPPSLSMDPEFDVFRRLDARETAPSIGQVFGEDRVLAVLPADAPAAERQAYESLIRGWESPAQSADFVLDSELESLPTDRGVWLLGRDNRIARALFSDNAIARVTIGDDHLRIADTKLKDSGSSTVLLARNPGAADRAVGWIAVEPEAAFAGMGRKLPHYGKYSYLAFSGEEPVNTLKGEWAATDSPFLLDLRPAAGQTTPLPQAELPQRAALAELPSTFSRERMLADVQWLAAPEREGRGVGTRGLNESADYLIAAFREIGLSAPDKLPDYRQNFRIDAGPDGQAHTLSNIIGYLPGNDPRHAGEAVIISAHYDHLGYGWPDERAAAAPGALYAGADDNASGVAVMLELARAYAGGPPPARNLVFIAFSGEEAGLLGSRHYAENPEPVATENILAAINMDTVGRLGRQPVSILATESATEWPHVFRGVGFTTGIKTRSVPGAAASSDQQSFIDVGIPAVQIFTGAHLDYHRPTDTADKIDGDGLVRVATIVRETTNYLLGREEALTFTGAATAARAPQAGTAVDNAQRRRVSFGTVPDFAFNGPGVKVESVVPGSPAESAGIRGGDIIESLDGKQVTDLGGFSDMLKQYAAGDRITATGRRDGVAFEVEMELTAR